METRFGLKPMGQGKQLDKQAAPDGPARVMKQGDWGAVQEQGMKGFQMEALKMPGRVQPKPNPMETKLAEMAREAVRTRELHQQALIKAAREGEAAAHAAMEKGREEGVRQGEKQAWEKYEKALEELRGNAAAALGMLQREKAALFLEFEGQVLELLSSSIHRVFEGVAKDHAEAVLPLVRKAVIALGQASNMTLKVNPADFKTAQDNQDFWLPVDAALKDIRIISDERIPKGGCFVESDSTSVGLQADQLAERIDEELKRVFLAKVQELKGPDSPSLSGEGSVELPGGSVEPGDSVP